MHCGQNVSWQLLEVTSADLLDTMVYLFTYLFIYYFFIVPHCCAQRKMQPIVTDVACSVCLCIHLLSQWQN